MAGKKQLQRRDADGLTLDMRKFLNALAEGAGDWTKACAGAKVSKETIRRWLRTDADFQRAYDSLFGSVADIGRRIMEQNAERAAEVLGEALEANTDKEITCPFCNNEFMISITDWSARLKAADTTLRGSGALVEKRKTEHTVTGTITHRHELPLPMQLALAQLDAGYPVNPRTYRALEDAGYRDHIDKLERQYQKRLVEGGGAGAVDAATEAEWRPIEEEGAGDGDQVLPG